MKLVKNLSVLIVAFALSVTCYSQTEKQTKNTKEQSKEDNTPLLTAMGAYSAGYILSTQEAIESAIELHSNKVISKDDVKMKLSVQKSIAEMVASQSEDLLKSKILDPETDQIYVADLVKILKGISKEADAYLNYIKNADANAKKEYDTVRAEVRKKIATALQMEHY